jgi:imidazolonepropionase-like amidohydrolase
MGGGIVSTVNQTRNATDLELFELGKKRLETALKSGTTHIESKSGYGLNLETELRLLEVSKEFISCAPGFTIDGPYLARSACHTGGDESQRITLNH